MKRNFGDCKMLRVLRGIIKNLTKPDWLFCTCCNKYSKQFLEFGVIPREDAQCPNCKALERHRLLLLYLKKETDLFKRKTRLLHFAPKPSLFKIFSSLQIEYFTADLDFDLAKYKVDINNLPFADNSFDMIICYHVFEHIRNDRKAMRELYQVLNQRGKL